MRLPDRRLLLVLLALAVVIVTVSLALRLRKEERPQVEAGASGPALAGRAVRGGEVSLGGLRGHVVLVSFLNSRAEATPEGDPSRAQIVFLRSMWTQHARFGLRVIVVDAAELAGAGKPSRSELVNDTYDWNLSPGIDLVPDDGSLANRFAVEEVPTTFLIGPDGAVRQRWDGFVRAAQLVRADVEGAAERDRVTEEVARSDRTAAEAGAGVRAVVDRRRAGLERPLRRRPADSVVTEAVHQWVLVVDAVCLGIRVGERAARVVVEVVVPCAVVQHADVAEHVRDRRGDKVVLEDGPRFGVSTAGTVEIG